MASYLPFLFLLLTTTALPLAAATANITATRSLSPSSNFRLPLSPLPPPPLSSPSFPLLFPLPPPPHPQEAQFNTIMDALNNAGDFSNWANLLAEVDPSIIPFSATLFVPDDSSFFAAVDSGLSLNFVDPLLFPYHIVPFAIPFSTLRFFPTGSRLPTLLPGYFLLITNHSAANFTIDGAPLYRPDLYQNALVSVHGVGGVFDYNLFGRDPPPPSPPPPPPAWQEFNRGEDAVEEEDVVEGDEKSPAVYETINCAAPSCGAGFCVGLLALFWVSRNAE